MTSTIKVNNVQNQCGQNIINENSNTITLGASGDTIALASGASQTGFGRTGTVDWDTTAKTASFTAVSGNGYFVNTTSGAITVTLPATPSAGDIVGIKDYAGTFGTNNVTVARNGSLIDGTTTDATLSTNQLSVFFVYVDGTQGWKATQSDAGGYGAAYIVATGGTITTSGDFKIHTFTGPGTFCVSCAGNPAGSVLVDYMVVAGGGGAGGSGSTSGGGGYGSGAGGAGGYRESSGTASGCYTVSPLGACVSALSVSVTGYPITVGAGGAGGPTPAPSTPAQIGVSGSNSVFSTITSTGGGGGAGATTCGSDGGSGGGKSTSGGFGSGNTPPVSPPQGNNGGSTDGNGNVGGGGGGGATGAGGQGGSGAGPQIGGAGGAGATSSINTTPTARAGGGAGGGGGDAPANNAGGTATAGGGNGGNTGVAGSNATINTGGGGGGSGGNPGKTGGSGGSGIVIIRYKFQ
jgi:hypothetical protein